MRQTVGGSRTLCSQITCPKGSGCAALLQMNPTLGSDDLRIGSLELKPRASHTAFMTQRRATLFRRNKAAMVMKRRYIEHVLCNGVHVLLYCTVLYMYMYMSVHTCTCTSTYRPVLNFECRPGSQELIRNWRNFASRSPKDFRCRQRAAILQLYSSRLVHVHVLLLYTL